MYDYREAVKNDVLDYIRENINFLDYYSINQLEMELYDRLFCEDSVTGNASGSYTFNSYEAEENLCHNLDLLGEALDEFCCDSDYLTKNGAEAADVTIRCYLLGEAISRAMKEIEDDFDAAYEAYEESETEDPVIPLADLYAECASEVMDL